MKFSILTTLVLFAQICCAQSNIERLDSTMISEKDLTTQIQTLMDSAKVTGLAVAVFNANKLVYKKAFGYSNAAKKSPLTTQSGFYGASLSKAVFGRIVVELAQKGIIDLDRPLQDYCDTPIPAIYFEKEWRGFADLKGDERCERITARMCLSHTTGFPNWRWITKTGEFDPDGKLLIRFEPGSRYSYSGEGIALLQYVVEKLTEKGTEQLARELVFDPLGMHMTSYVWQERFEGKYCNGHNTAGQVIDKDTEDEAGAAGSMETTLDDFSLFIEDILAKASSKSLLTDSLFAPQVRIRSKAQFGPNAFTDANDNDAIALSYGLGWGLLKSPYSYGAFKEGHGEGFQHYCIVFPESGIGIIILSNSDNGESIFKQLLELAIGDTFTPYIWENYIPYDHK